MPMATVSELTPSLVKVIFETPEMILQLPPMEDSLNVMAELTQTADNPEIAATDG